MKKYCKLGINTYEEYFCKKFLVNILTCNIRILKKSILKNFRSHCTHYSAYCFDHCIQFELIYYKNKILLFGL